MVIKTTCICTTPSQSAVRSHGHFSWRWRCHGVLTTTLAFLRSSMAFLRRSTAIACALMALTIRASSCHGARTACYRHSHCADDVLFAFGGSWNNWQGPLIAVQAWSYVTRTWTCISRLPLSSHTRTQRLLRIGVLLRLRLKMISTASVSSCFCRTCV